MRQLLTAGLLKESTPADRGAMRRCVKLWLGNAVSTFLDLLDD
jgi:hypothetical protein